MALTRARVVSGAPDFSARIETTIREVLCRPRDARIIACDVVEMRAAIAREKGDANVWDLKYAAGALIDIEFIAQYLQLIHAATTPEILDTSTARALEKAARLGAAQTGGRRGAAPGGAAVSRFDANLAALPAAAFDPKTANTGVLELLARAADLPDFPALQAHVEDTQRQVRECFVRILGQRQLVYALNNSG